MVLKSGLIQKPKLRMRKIVGSNILRNIHCSTQIKALVAHHKAFFRNNFYYMPGHGSIIPRIIKNSIAASTAETGTVIIQAATIFNKADRFTSSCR